MMTVDLVTALLLMQVTITVADVNDNPPVFVSYASNMTVSEAAAVGTVVGTFATHDADLQAPVALSITCVLPRDDRKFYINSTTGWYFAFLTRTRCSISFGFFFMKALIRQSGGGVKSVSTLFLVNVMEKMKQIGMKLI